MKNWLHHRTHHCWIATHTRHPGVMLHVCYPRRLWFGHVHYCLTDMAGNQGNLIFTDEEAFLAVAHAPEGTDLFALVREFEGEDA